MSKVTMSGAWDRTTQFLSDHGGAAATIAGATLFVPGAVQGVLEPVQAAAAATGGNLLLSLAFVAIALLALFGQLALVALAIDPAPDRGRALAVAAARFLPMIGITLVVMIALFLAALPPILLLAADGMDFVAAMAGSRPDVSPGTGLLLVLYILVLLPVMIWLAARLSLLSAVIVGERRGLGAIARSWRLTRGIALRIAGAIILLGVVGVVALLAAQTVFGSIFRIALGDEGTVNAAVVLTAIVVALVSAAFTTVFSVFLAKVYVAAAARAEAAVPA